MTTDTPAGVSPETPGAARIPLWSLLLRIVVFSAILGALMFLAAGRLSWTAGWLYLAAFVAVSLGGALWVQIDRELEAERTQIKADVKNWDKVIATILSVAVPVVMPILAALDARFGWSPHVALWVSLLALLAYVLGNAFSLWAGATNKFFARYVRIQTERGHYVVDGGPYRTVRHPGYAGGSVAVLAMPLLLDSLWSFVVAGLMMALIVVRTALEDRTLQAELPGYAEYTTRTRYRLLPGVW